MKLDKRSAIELQAAIKAAILPILAAKGMTLSKNRARFNETMLSLKLELLTSDFSPANDPLFQYMEFKAGDKVKQEGHNVCYTITGLTKRGLYLVKIFGQPDSKEYRFKRGAKLVKAD